MAQGLQSRFRTSMLNYIREGMLVFDINGKTVGLVTHVQFGEEDNNDPITDYPNPNFFSLNPEEAVDGTEAQLLRSGYVRVDGGLFVSDRFITPEQIVLVTNDRIELNIAEDELISL
jgi:hypothetical protein